MNKNPNRIVILSAVFVAAVILFSVLNSQVSDDLTSAMSDPTLPVVSFYDGDIRINELYGYTTEMDVTAVRDSITPVGTDHKLSCRIDTYGAAVSDVTYEIRSLDGETLISSVEVDDVSSSGSSLAVNLSISSILEEGTEYLMMLKLHTGEKDAVYYTRLMYVTDTDAAACLSFAREFHEKTFTSDASSDFFPTYVEATTGDSGTLQYVDLHSSLSQITWGDMEVSEVTAAVPSFKEINSFYNVITIEYVVSSVNDSGETEFYDVEEYFRLRQTQTRIYVLNYERTMNRIFRGEDDFISEDGNLLLGIRDSDVAYETNADGTIVAFVQEGDLWCFDTAANTISRIFSFRSLEGRDEREYRNEHDVRIVSVDEDNNIDFIVYGYMNCGRHEGEVGTMVYHYDASTHTIQELAYLPAQTSYEVLKAEMGQLMYENSDRNLYYIMQGTIYQMNLDTLKMTEILSGMESGNYSVSKSGRFVAWGDESNAVGSRVIHVLDLNDDTIFDIQAAEETYIYPLAFMEEDFIYGIARTTDIQTDSTGIVTVPMKQLQIMDLTDGNHEVVKEYTPLKNCYLSDIEIKDATIEVKLLKYENGRYVSDGTDAIVNQAADTNTIVGCDTVSAGNRLREVELTMHNTISSGRRRMVASSELMNEEETIVQTENSGEKQELYYVYVKGDIFQVTDDCSKAVQTANENLGVVVSSNTDYVWMRARRSGVNPMQGAEVNTSDLQGTIAEQALSAFMSVENNSISITQAISSGSTFKEILQENLPDKRIIELTGCKTDDMLFYISSGNPVLAMTGNDTALLITGYSSEAVFCFDPSTSQTVKLTMEEADQNFYSGGYQYLTCLDVQ